MIIFTPHALLKLKQRGIPPKLVEEALKSPDYNFSSYAERKIIYKKFAKLYLKVIYKISGEDVVIITQHWEDKPKLIR